MLSPDKDPETHLFFIRLFERQTELSHKYSSIEQKNGFFYSHTCRDLDSHATQGLIRRLIGFANEELMEALNVDNDAPDREAHFIEEMIDGLHFLTELLIVLGIEPQSLDVQTIWDNQLEARTTFSHCQQAYLKTMGLALNCLKNKPWKQDLIETNRDKFFMNLLLAYEYYLRMLFSMKLFPSEVLNFYLNKSNINDFRIKTGY